MYNTPVPARTSMLDFIKTSMGCQFVIPVYQRNYTWEAKNAVEQFLDDAERLLYNEADAHFFGIVIYLDLPRTFKHHEYQVVDGQQRLTTMFLTLYALKHISIETKSDAIFADQLDEMFLINKFIEDDSMKLKLKPLVSDDNVYSKIVNGDFKGITAEERQSNVYKNYVAIKNRVLLWLKDNTFDEILGALQKLYIVTIPLIATDDPQQIFESINSKGTPLTAADLIRNYLLMGEEDSAQEKLYEKYWKVLESKIPESKDLEEFFRMFLANQNFDLPKKHDVYAAFKIWCRGKQSDKQELFGIVDKYMTYYYSIYHDKEVERLLPALKFFRKTGSVLPAPFLMEMYKWYDEEKISLEDLNQIIDLVDVYLIRRALVSRNTSEITRFFPSLLRNVVLSTTDNYHNVVENTKYYLVNKTKQTAMKMPTDQEIAEFLSCNDAYLLKSATRAVFEKMELLNNSAQVDLSNLTIEHLLPQAPTPYWYQYVSKEDYEKYVGLIGNLTLATNLDNSKMNNNEWQHKKSILETTKHIKLNEEILKSDTWGVEQIKERTQKLINKIIEIYPYEESTLEKAPLSDDQEAKYLEEKRKVRSLLKMRRSNFSFDALEIPNGSRLVFARNEAETCTVVGENKVSYNGQEYSLSGLAKELLHKHGIYWTTVQGASEFKYNGELLTERRARIERGELPIEL